jgi:hypothetical protein
MASPCFTRATFSEVMATDWALRYFGVRRVIHQQIDVLGEPARAMCQDGEPANQHIPRAGVVQGAADADEVFRLRCSCVRLIILVIHASASSKLEKR